MEAFNGGNHLSEVAVDVADLLGQVSGIPRGLPGASRIDHLALTVPDIAQAIEFFVTVLGGELVYRLPRLACDDDWMQQRLDVHPRATAEIALVRLGPLTNLELFEYSAPDHNPLPPSPCDVGSFHLALHVEDIDAAAAFLRDHHGLHEYGPVCTVEANSPMAGTRWIRLSTPWRMPIELRSGPRSLPYEQRTHARRSTPWISPDPATKAARALDPTAGFGWLDHAALSVADLDEAIAFFVGALGAELLYQTSHDLADAAFAAALGVPVGGIVESAALRMGPTDTVELSCYHTVRTRTSPPSNSDVGGRHLAIHVDDVDVAASQLGFWPGCLILGEPETIADGPIAGDRWVYVRTPIGLHIELVNMPDGQLPYEQQTVARRRSAHGFRWWDR